MKDIGADPSELLATYIENLSHPGVPPEAITTAKRSIIDAIGVMMAGLEEEPANLTSEFIKLHSGDGPNTIYKSGVTASPMDAALVHGTALHALDFDDTSAATYGHPSAAMVPALLSISETDNSSGPDLLTAYVAGFETQSLIAGPILESHYSAGWHTTATLGVFGATAATAKLLDLSSQKIRHSLNMAASMASGLKSNFGSMTKPLHAGHAARSGLTATLLAKEGFTAAPTAMSDDGGFFELYNDESEADVSAVRPTNDEWFILEKGIHLKKYPSCHYTHSIIESVIELATNHDIEPNEVERIHVIGSPGAVDTADITYPETGLEGKFSVPFLVACAILFRTIRLDTFVKEKVSDEQVRELMERVTFDTNEERSYGSLSSDLEIRTQDGEQYVVDNAVAPGLHGINPLTESELQEKFLMCSTRVLDDGDAEELWELLQDIGTLGDLSGMHNRLA
jgi:2-methylcitrate dehydratase PrpD